MIYAITVDPIISNSLFYAKNTFSGVQASVDCERYSIFTINILCNEGRIIFDISYNRETRHEEMIQKWFLGIKENLEEIFKIFSEMP